MTAEDRCKVYKDLFKWAENKENEITYLEEGIYAARVSPECVVLIKANSEQEAYRKVWEGEV